MNPLQLITITQAKAHSNIVSTDRDVDIDFKVSQASAIVMNYIKKSEVPAAWVENYSPLVYDIPFDVQAATCLVFAELFEQRESQVAMPLSQAVMDLLERHRDPALA